MRSTLFAMLLSSSAFAGEPVIELGRAAEFAGLCRDYEAKLSTTYTDAVQESYTTAISNSVAIKGGPEILFKSAITGDSNPGEATLWTICLPVVQFQASPEIPYSIRQIGPSDAVLATCGMTEEERRACSNAIRKYVSENRLLITRMQRIESKPNNLIVVTTAVGLADAN